jgi:hypothetical protein
MRSFPNHVQGLMFRPLQVFLLISSAAFACAQPPSNTPLNTTTGLNSAVVTFTLDFPESSPDHYSIRIPSTGAAHYQSTGRLSADSDVTDKFDYDFPISNESRSRVFALAAKSGYFQKDLEAHHKNIAFTGKKTLQYADGNRTGESTYNYSTNAAVQELTSLFQNLSATLEFGHRLDYYHRYQKLALEDELKRMQEMAQDNTLIEVAAIQPILEQIVADQSVINVTRARALRLMAGKSGR